MAPRQERCLPNVTVNVVEVVDEARYRALVELLLEILRANEARDGEQVADTGPSE